MLSNLSFYRGYTLLNLCRCATEIVLEEPRMLPTFPGYLKCAPCANFPKDHCCEFWSGRSGVDKIGERSEILVSRFPQQKHARALAALTLI